MCIIGRDLGTLFSPGLALEIDTQSVWEWKVIALLIRVSQFLWHLCGITQTSFAENFLLHQTCESCWNCKKKRIKWYKCGFCHPLLEMKGATRKCCRTFRRVHYLWGIRGLDGCFQHIHWPELHKLHASLSGWFIRFFDLSSSSQEGEEPDLDLHESRLLQLSDIIHVFRQMC